MADRMIVTSTIDIEEAFRSRVEDITVIPPEGKSVGEFLPDLVIHASTLPELKGFDIYEVEAILRHMSSAH